MASASTVNKDETSTEIETLPNVHISNHPVLSHKISILRSTETKPSEFRAVLREITFHIGYEATSSLKTKPVALTVPVKNEHVETSGKTLSDRVALIPILRSGLGMIDAMLELLPNAGIHHLGMYKKDSMVVQYYNRLPRKCESDVAFVLDPVISTANTILSVIGILKKWGVAKIHVVSVVAAKEGVKLISQTHPDVTITVGTIDPEINDSGVVVPGIGDAGDRLFGTPLIEDEEALLHPSKRRKMSMDEN